VDNLLLEAQLIRVIAISYQTFPVRITGLRTDFWTADRGPKFTDSNTHISKVKPIRAIPPKFARPQRLQGMRTTSTLTTDGIGRREHVIRQIRAGVGKNVDGRH